MKTKRFCIFLGILLVAMIGGLGWQVLRPREPVYQGKPASVWINSLQNGFDPQDWRPLGTNAVPLLIQALGKHDGPVGKLYFKIWPKLPFVLRKRVPKPVDAEHVRWEAANGFIFFHGSQARRVVPALLRALEDESPTVRLNASCSLACFSKEKDFLQVSKQAMNNRDKNVRVNIVAALRLCPGREEATALALKALSDPELEVRTTAAKSLMRMDAPRAVKEGAVPLILKSLNVTNEFYYAEIGALSNAPALVTPLLVEALADPDPSVRASATNALNIIAPEAAAKAGVQ